jgi:hypothetical protein
VTDTRERLIQFKTNIDVVSVLDRNGLGDWLAVFPTHNPPQLGEIGGRFT